MTDEPDVHLVVGWDRYPPSTAALHFGIDLARRLGACVHVVHILDVDDEPLDPDTDSWEVQAGIAVAAAEAEALEELSGQEVAWKYHRAHGPATAALLGVAHQYAALMIILGSPRGGPASALDALLGQSVSHRLIGAKRVPLVLVPAP
ncbi:Universal stress protein family protein [Mycobacteroides salmoniphilum]|uniref:Universal stress protein family protein n=1 Tax=Mycobacteroides salmoniphilum TaxID=404941 RepID=A0A4R8S449_9MYCO|nr:universal stress protein [Mycobacteroides salmoniphilum]TDZ77712.1 Universal stress protein family protein [Mycobacteroides salmoniphilum]TDZ82343.1 Universal stress protein family protein [Mycobacteroides salmoniphilum]TDZ85358.1 Universal stress protein family protein [Mycobacteroides salmoniphilum]